MHVWCYVVGLVRCVCSAVVALGGRIWSRLLVVHAGLALAVCLRTQSPVDVESVVGNAEWRQWAVSREP